MMKVFAGTYQGNVFFLQGTPNALRVRSVQPVSENSLRTMTIADNQLIVGGYDQEIRALHLSSGVETKESKDSKGVINCIRAINNKDIVLGLDSGAIRFWDKTSWSSRRDIKEHKKAITDIKIDKKGLMMVSVAGHQIIFWNLSTFKSLYHFRYDFDIQHVLLVDNFQFIFLLSDKTVRQIETQDNKELFKFSIEDKIQCGLIFQNYLLLATEKGEIKIWNHGHYEFCIHFKAHDQRIKDMKIGAIEDGDFLVTADSSGVIKVWDILEFLKGVDSISQDYNLEGLKPLSSVETKQRVICIEVAGSQSLKEEKGQEVEEIENNEKVEQQQPERKQSKKKNKKKLIEKQQKSKLEKKKKK